MITGGEDWPVTLAPHPGDSGRRGGGGRESSSNSLSMLLKPEISSVRTDEPPVSPNVDWHKLSQEDSCAPAVRIKTQRSRRASQSA